MHILLLYSAHFDKKNKTVEKSVQSACCAVVKCALCSSVRSDLSTFFKRPHKKKVMLRISLKMVENWRNCRQISFRACLHVSPFKKLRVLITYSSKLWVLKTHSNRAKYAPASTSLFFQPNIFSIQGKSAFTQYLTWNIHYIFLRNSFKHTSSSLYLLLWSTYPPLNRF